MQAITEWLRRVPYLERWLCFSAVLVLLAAIFIHGRNDIRFSFRLEAPVPGSVQLYYSDDVGFSEARSQIFAVGTADDRYTTIPIPGTLSRGVRVDPQPGMTQLQICDLTFRMGSMQWGMGSGQFHGTGDVRVANSGKCTTLSVDTQAADPQVLLDTGPFQRQIQEASRAAERWTKALVSVAMLLFLCVTLLRKWRNGKAEAGLTIPSLHRRLPWIYLALAVVFGSLFTLVTPPGGVPDEPAHLAKVVLLENGYWVGGHEAAVLDPPVSHVLGPFDGFLNPSSKFSVAEVIEHASTPLHCRPDKENFPGSAAGYSPSMYVVGAVLLNASCRTEGSIGGFFYVARWINLLLAVVLTFVGLRAAGPFSWPIAMFALMPMTLFEQASLTADSMTLGLSFLLIGLHVGVASGHLQLRRGVETSIFVVSIALAFTKPGAAWLCAGFLLAWPAYRPERGRFAVMCCTLILLPWVLHVAWVIWSAQFGIPREGIDVSTNVRMLIGEPWRVGTLILNTFTEEEGEFLYMSVVGRLGWLDVVMSYWAYSLGYIVIGVSLLMKGDGARDFPRAWRPIAFLLGAGAMLIPVLPMYLYWTSQGSAVVQGLQGRYFIPMLAFIACWLAWRVPYARFSVACFSLLSLVVINANALYHLVARYYG